MIKFISNSPQETLAFGEKLGTILTAGSIIALDGSLGTGKTVMAKGIIMGALKIDPSYVTSPAFSLVNEHRASDKAFILYHMDFYRLEDLTNEDIEMFSEYLVDDDGITVVEWGSRFLPDLCDNYLMIKMDHLDLENENVRQIEVQQYGEANRYFNLLEKIKNYVNTDS